MSEKIKIKRGLRENLPSLDFAELGYCYDTNELYIGGQTKNELLSGLTSSTSIVYNLELNRWNVKNNGTDATNTTSGINNALQWATSNGYTEFVLPKGTYLIAKNSYIELPSYMTFNLNGSTLQKETNGSEYYAVIRLSSNQKNTRITNGIIKGDRTTHDYTTISGTHEGGYGVEIGTSQNAIAGVLSGNNLRNITIDNLDIYDCTGDAIIINSGFNQILPIPTTLASSWESGKINSTTGALESDSTKVRSTIKFDMTQSLIVQNGYFGLYGSSFGALGSDIITDYYDVFFYKADNTFISSTPYIQFFEEVEVPPLANYAKIMLHQPSVPAAANCSINVRVPTFPRWVRIEDCNLHHSRRQGISVCGAKEIYIGRNEIHHIGGETVDTGTTPQSGIDIEDGYDLNQYIYVDKNNFHHNNRYNIIAVNGKHLYITNNTFMATISNGYVSLAINGGTDKVIVSGNVIKLSKVSLVGEINFTNNYVYGTQITPNPAYATRPINIANNMFHNCKFVFDSPFPYLVKLDNCRFYNDIDKTNNAFGLAWTLELKNTPQLISNCTFEGQDYSYLLYSTVGTYQGGWRFENCRFKNTKSLGLNSGIYNGCIFTDITGDIGVANQSGGNDTLELRGCKFFSTDSNGTLLTFNSLKSVQMIDCHIEKTSGWILKVGNVSGDVVLRGNTFKVLNDSAARAILTLDSTFTGTSMILEDNKIIATNSTRVGIDDLISNNSIIIIKNNTLTKATINLNGKEVAFNNIVNGERDPNFKGISAPTSTPAYIGQEYFDTTNKKLYRAFGTSSSVDWIIMN